MKKTKIPYIHIWSCQNLKIQAGEMFRLLRALLESIWFYLLAPAYQLTTVCKCSSRASDGLIWLQQVLRTCGAQIHVQAKHLYTQNEKKFKVDNWLVRLSGGGSCWLRPFDFMALLNISSSLHPSLGIKNPTEEIACGLLRSIFTEA